MNLISYSIFKYALQNQPYIYLYTTVQVHIFFALCIFLKELLTTYNTYVCKIYNYNPLSRVRNSGNETFQWFSSEVQGTPNTKSWFEGSYLCARPSLSLCTKCLQSLNSYLAIFQFQIIQNQAAKIGCNLIICGIKYNMILLGIIELRE